MTLVTCHRCHAQYKSGGRWRIGYDRSPEGSTSSHRDVDWSVIVEKGNCPICRQPPQLEPTPESTAM